MYQQSPQQDQEKSLDLLLVVFDKKVTKLPALQLLCFASSFRLALSGRCECVFDASHQMKVW